MYSVKENFKSLLFYLGMLTIKEQGPIGTVLKIPNHVIKTIYWEQYFQKINEDYDIQIRDVRIAVNEMRMNGNIEPFIEFLKRILEDLSNRDLIQMDEKHVKMMILTLLGVDSTYFVQSEAENNKGYVDILLKRKIQFKDITKFQYLIELRFINETPTPNVVGVSDSHKRQAFGSLLKESERNTLEKVKEEGLKQLKSYEESNFVRQEFEGDDLKKILVIVIGKKDIYTF